MYPRPILPRLYELEAFKSYWFATITPYGRDIEPNVPQVGQVIRDVQTLSKALGSHRVCWRYDPIFIDEHYTVERHIEEFGKMAKDLSGYVYECVISFIDLYEKTKRNFPSAREVSKEEQIRIAKGFSQIGRQYRISVKTCAEAADLRSYGVERSGCITQTVVEKANGALTKKDCEELASCYRSCLTLAAEHGLVSVAFCCISTGEFHFPHQKAAEIAVQTVKDFLRTNMKIQKVVFNVFKDEDLFIYKNLLI